VADVLHFDIDNALDHMLDLFWRQGFKKTTTKELAECAGLSESSLFNTFGSKKMVFLKTLDRYEIVTNRMRKLLNREDSALGGIQDYWNFICKYAADDSKTNGCFVTNACIEHADDNEIIPHVKKNIETQEKALKATLARAVKIGELKAGTDTTALAQYLLHSAQGIRVLARLTPSKKKMKNIASVTLSVLDQYRVK
jgi:TetR/AcrR family transcriptional repressor of nem operon